MFAHKILLVSTLMVMASVALAQTEATERTAAELPEISEKERGHPNRSLSRALRTSKTSRRTIFGSG